MEKLKPCPFCGGEADYCYFKIFTTKMVKVVCTKCSCELRAGDVEIEQATKSWNTRYEPPTPGGIFVPAGNDRFKKVMMSKNIGGKG